VPSLDPPPRPPLLERALWALVALVCIVAIGAIVILPDNSKVVDLVYGGF
jgi:hypothetical protein